MNEHIKHFSQAFKQVKFTKYHQCYDAQDANMIKHLVQDGYHFLAREVYHKSFFNFGLWDQKLYHEYSKLEFNFNKICDVQDIYSQLLLYYLISPLIQIQFFDKNILDIGCGNGVGLRASSELLKAKYALGIDLVNKLATNSHNNFYEANLRNYIQADAENLPIESECFDIITNLESAHLYPRIENFFAEVDRILRPGGYFCFADIHVESKQQAKKIEAFVKTKPNLIIVQKRDITKMVQSSIYQRLIVNEDIFYKNVKILFGEEEAYLSNELTAIAFAMGLRFLPWWKIRFKNPELHHLAKHARKKSLSYNEYYFYYLIQKIK